MPRLLPGPWRAWGRTSPRSFLIVTHGPLTPPHAHFQRRTPAMDYDRRSTVSSFYGARKSTDVLDSTASPPLDPPRRPRAGSGAASSFYNPNRASKAGTDYAGGTPSAGYNRTSYFFQGREEPVKGVEDEEHGMLSKPDDAFDIYADFNNSGPRYAAAFGRQDTG